MSDISLSVIRIRNPYMRVKHRYSLTTQSRITGRQTIAKFNK